MKRLLCMLIVVAVSFQCSCSKKGINKVSITPLKGEWQDSYIPWSEQDYKSVLKPYNIKPDLSNVYNASILPQEDIVDKYVLFRRSFIIKKPKEIFEQPFNVYEKNAEDKIPNFITADSILHIYHLMCDYVMRGIERERMVDELKSFTEKSFNRSIEIYNGIKEPNAKKAALKNVAYFGIAMRLLEFDLPGGIPLEANRIIDNDTKRVKSRWMSGTSEIFPYTIDYKKYIARGHYSRESDFRNYFLTMMWYGSTPFLFEIYDSKNGDFQRMDEQILMAVIMTSQTLGDESLRKLWDDIYRASSFYLGKAQDITMYDLSDIIKNTYGEKIDFNKICDEEKIKVVYKQAKDRYYMHSKECIGGRISRLREDSDAQAQFRLMGQIYNLDNDIYNNLTEVNDPDTGKARLLPKGLDIPSSFGNKTAYEVLTQQMSEDKLWMKYPENIERLRAVLSEKSSDNPSGYSLNNSLFWILKGYNMPYGKGYPSYMANNYWDDKKLLTYIGAVSDTRHPTYLTAKQGGKKDEEKIAAVEHEMPGYVEPEINLYNRLEYMSKHIREFLTVNDFYNSSMYSLLDNFTDTVSFLKDISLKELDNKPLTDEEELRLKTYAKELKDLTLNAVEGKGSTKNWDGIAKVDRNMACVSDAYMYENQVLQTAVGAPDYIYVVVPYKDKLYITRGSVYSYYEFIQPVSKKLEDSEWQNMIKDGKEIEQQDWVKRIRAD